MYLSKVVVEEKARSA